MKNPIRLLSALALAALLAGCVTAGDYDPGRDRDRGPAYGEEGRREVSGIVERVDRVNRRIVVVEDAQAHDRDRYERRGREIAIYYDRGPIVGRDGRPYRPQDLERGDRIRAEVETTDAGLMIRDLERLTDGRGGEGRDTRPGPVPGPEAGGDVEPVPVPGPPPAPPSDLPSAPGPDDRDRRDAEPLRGIVRYVDTSARVLDIETPAGYGPSGRPGIVRVQYDDNTVVEHQGRRYSPENLERGDRVEIDIRDLGGRGLLAEQIVVVGQGRSEER